MIDDVIFVSSLFALLMLPRTLAMASTTSTTINTRSNQRKFQFVPYGSSAPTATETGRTTISCDGRIPGTTLELTHWTDNVTPDSLYADTSTEIALNFASQQEDTSNNNENDFSNALILNNHYDTDGVLSVYACLEPEHATKYKQLLVEGAEAGDFGEWSSDSGVRLDCALSHLCIGVDDDEAYEKAFETLPKLLEDLVTTGGDAYKELWSSGFEDAMSGWNDLQEGRATLRRAPESTKIVILEEATSTSQMSPYALHRGLKEQNLWEGTTRILRVNKSENNKNADFRYGYEKIGHGWVQKLVQRHLVPSANGDEIATKMNEYFKCSQWKKGGSSGLVSICQASHHSVTPNEIAEALSSVDAGAQ